LLRLFRNFRGNKAFQREQQEKTNQPSKVENQQKFWDFNCQENEVCAMQNKEQNSWKSDLIWI
jgi:invasion protein IalB